MILDQHGDAIICSKCESDNVIRSGMARGKQRFQCKDCGAYFIAKTVTERMHQVTRIKAAMIMYLAGAKIQDMQVLFDVSHPTISKWIEPLQDFIESQDDLKIVRRKEGLNLEFISSIKSIPPKSKKHWLVVELDDDYFEGRNALLSSD